MTSQKDLYTKLYDPLRTLGLSDNEITLYTLSLALGPVSIAQLAELMNMPRPNIYKVIAALEQHGFAQFSSRKKYARTFTVESPAIIPTKLREREQQIAKQDRLVTSLLPDLMTAFQQGGSTLKIKVLTTREEMIAILRQMTAEEKECMKLFGSIGNLIQAISPAIFSSFTELRLERKIGAKILTTKSAEANALAEKGARENREVRFLPESKNFPTTFQLGSNKVLLWQKDSLTAILIEENYIAQMFQSIFDYLWESTKTTD